MHEKNPILEAKEIEKDFLLSHNQTLHVLKKINLTVYPREVVAIIGPSGCGKSTLLRILAGLIPQTRGQIFYHGKVLEGLSPKVSFVFQTFALFPWMTVEENINVVLKAKRFSVDEMKKKTQDAIALIGLKGFEEAYPKEISGGMKQRLGMARALVTSPEILFMDEPFSELDPFTAEVLRSEVIDIWSKKEVGFSSILLASHDLEEVVFMADRIIVMGINPGEILAVIENKIPRPRNYHSQDFINLRERLHDTYGNLKPPSKEKISRKEKTIGPLLPTTFDQITGLLDFLNRHGGTQDIFKIGAEKHQHFDKIIIILQAAELLDFVEIIHRTVNLTQKGKELLKGNRSQIWKEQLMTIPLFIKIIDLLKKAPNQSLHRDELMRFLVQALPFQDANVQLDTLIRWGHYGNLFSYRRLTHRLKLHP